jgi:molecular chaperone GrpE
MSGRNIPIQSEGDEGEPREVPAVAEETDPPDAPESPLSLDEELARLSEALDREQDAHLRAVAELRNYRQRAAREQAEQSKYAVAEVLSVLIPSLDHLEMALETATEQEETTTALAEGVWMTFRQLLDTLGQFGLKRIPTDGEFFNPDWHEAVEREEVEGEVPCEGTITGTLRTGYMLHDRVLRPADVRVAVKAS